MSETSPRQPSPHDSDYDGAWKDTLRVHFRELLEKYFPAAAETIDWRHPPQWSDKELSQILGQVGQRNRTVDLLVQVRLRSGEPQWILLHLEVQTSYEADFAEFWSAATCRRFPILWLSHFQGIAPSQV